MKPGKIDHPEVKNWIGPEGSGIADLNAVTDEDGIIWSRWVPSTADINAIKAGASVWVGILAEKQPPVCIAAGETLEAGGKVLEPKK